MASNNSDCQRQGCNQRVTRNTPQENREMRSLSHLVTPPAVTQWVRRFWKAWNTRTASNPDKPEVHSPESRNSPASFHTTESRGAVVIATGRWGRSLGKRGSGRASGGRWRQKPRVFAQMELSRNGKSKEQLYRTSSRTPFPRTQDLGSPWIRAVGTPTTFAARCLHDRKSRPGRQTNYRKARLFYRKPRPGLADVSAGSWGSGVEPPSWAPGSSLSPAAPSVEGETWLHVCRLGGEAKFGELWYFFFLLVGKKNLIQSKY